MLACCSPPTSTIGVDMEQLQPISRTYQYRKVMKPMLERKRRARINRCLDELKELMVGALEAEGENVSKLEKADVLELTVRHLHKLRRQRRLAGNPVRDMDRFRAGFSHCASEVSRCLASIPGVDIQLGTKLMTHLGHRLIEMDKMSPLTVQTSTPQSHYSPPASPVSPAPPQYSPPTSPTSDNSQTHFQITGTYYTMPLTPNSTSSSSGYSSGCSARSPRSSPPASSHHHVSSSPANCGLLQVVPMREESKSPVPLDLVWRPW